MEGTEAFKPLLTSLGELQITTTTDDMLRGIAVIAIVISSTKAAAQ